MSQHLACGGRIIDRGADNAILSARPGWKNGGRHPATCRNTAVSWNTRGARASILSIALVHIPGIDMRLHDCRPAQVDASTDMTDSQ